MCTYMCTSMFVCVHMCQCVYMIVCMTIRVCLWVHVSVHLNVHVCSDHDCQVCVSHSSIPTCKIPWTEEPSGLQSVRLQRVRHNLVTKQLCLYMCACVFVCVHIYLFISMCMYVSAWGHVCEVFVCVCIHGHRSTKCLPWRHNLRISCDSI